MSGEFERRFAANSFAGWRYQAYQAVTGAGVLLLAVGVLALHHFGFGWALAATLLAGFICLVARVPAMAATYAVICVLCAGVVLTASTGQETMPGVPLIDHGFEVEEPNEPQGLYVHESQPLEFDTPEWPPADGADVMPRPVFL